MAKAATQLATTQPTVSQAIADLEAAVGARLFDRSTQGVVLTQYGEVLLRSGLEAFDALRQGVRSIEFLSAPGAGDVWVGCPESLLLGFMPAVIQRLAKAHPKILLHVALADPAAGGFQPLRERRLDLMMSRWSSSRTDDDLLVETLLEDSFTVVTGAASPWARRKKVELAELMDEPWLYGEPANVIQARISEAILARCGRLPLVGVYTVAMSLRLALLAAGGYVSCIPASVYRHGVQGQPIKALPIDVGLKVPIAMISLKQRTLSPAVQVFIECARQVAQEMAREA
jgi:DNA-binding transcriptional LysR family regulator